MNSIKLLDRRVGYFAMAMALLLAFTLPTFVGAAHVTERSIALTNSTKGMPGVSYEVSFKPVVAAGAFVVDFCKNSPLIGATCEVPSGFSASAATSSSVGFTDVEKTATKVVVTGVMPQNTQVTVKLDGITNPSEAGPLYARIVTFATDTQADAYTSEVPGSNALDQGGVAMSITDTVGVKGAVLESMLFCVAKAAITKDCANATANLPTLTLGKTVGDVVALTPDEVSTGKLYTQISTNAVGGAVIYLKSATACGGLKRLSAATCDIAPALKTGILANEAKFGLMTGAVTDTDASSNGTLRATPATGYNNTTYVFNYDATNATGVTSTYGDAILDTDSAPVNGKNMELTFGASVTNNTPAGLYATDLSMIATGKF